MASAAKIKKPIAEQFADFAGEEDIHLISGDDNRPPVNFQGDVMKARTLSSKTLQGQGKFNYKWVVIAFNLVFFKYNFYWPFFLLSYSFETENGINVAQIGKLKDSKTFVVSGSYTYTGWYFDF